MNKYADLLNLAIVSVLIGLIVILLASCGQGDQFVVAGCIKPDNTVGSMVNGVCQ